MFIGSDLTGRSCFFGDPVSMNEAEGTITFWHCGMAACDLARNFGLQNVLISYFDPQGRFLSWTHRNGVLADCEGHPYRSCQPADVVRQTLYREAVQDNLTYNDVTPRLYHATRIIPPEDYKDMLVRVAGYSAYFVELGKPLQKDLIQRTELHF